MASYIYDIYEKCDTLYELRVTYVKREGVRERTTESECERERMNEWVSEQMRRSEGECASATFILCCARKNVNYSKVRPAITYHLLFQIITVCSKCNIKKKNYRYHEIKYSVRKHTRTYHYSGRFFSAEERWKTCRVALLEIKFSSNYVQ